VKIIRNSLIIREKKLKKKLRKMVLLCILTGENALSGDFLSEDMRPKKKPHRLIEPSVGT
jgi:hypothetical protein